MAQGFPLARSLRPAILIRRRALRHGIFGPSRIWRVIAMMIIVRGTLRQVFGKHPDHLGRRKIGVGHVITVAVATPMTRSERRRTGITRKSIEAAARTELEAAQRAS
jgi:hypothetical protein